MAIGSDIILKDLLTLYQPLRGESFEATYLGKEIMPQTDNERLKLEVSSMDPLEAKLEEISSKVLQEYGENVWKGITGPVDSVIYTNYWIWVKNGRGLESLEEYSTCQFKIVRCTPFKCSNGEFSHGVDIKVIRD